MSSSRSMIGLPGGTFLMGTDYAGGCCSEGESPVRYAAVEPFDIDVFPVTNIDFAAFVADTGYVTEAERFGWSFVFWAHVGEERFEQIVEDTAAETPWWCKVPGAYWQEPEGPGSDVALRGDHPVVHVSWNDAITYAKWEGKTLPTEAQWEFAARGGLEQKLYPWGDELTPGGIHLCNIWQGKFPLEDTAEDGYAGTCRVDAFPPNRYGLYSVTGNTWEWCADACGFNSKILKGGSFLCHASYCDRYRVAARIGNTSNDAASNMGFRCVRG